VKLTPRAILLIGWVGMMLYAFPGYMSFDSVAQLFEARLGYFSDGHPPAMAGLWQNVDHLITGPLGMLIIQITCFLLGTYFVLRQRVQPRTAAICAVLVLWFPPIANTMGVIWKDSQMAAFLMLGTALMLAPRLRVRLVGLALLGLATALRYNALAMTFELVMLLFVWNPELRWWKRYAIAFVAFIVITLGARVVTTELTYSPRFMWHRSIALLDIVGTIQYAPVLSDAELQRDLAGTPLIATTELQARARKIYRPEVSRTEQLWDATDKFFERPDNAAEREAVSRAWKTIVTSYPAAYLKYRSVVFFQLVQFDDTPLGSPVYFWFGDIQDLPRSAVYSDHDASPSRIQTLLHQAMAWLGDTWLFHVSLYCVIAILLLPLCRRDRIALALLSSGILGELFLFFIAPTVDVRYSFWLVLTTVLSLILVVAGRVRSRRTG
jgi:hypothetical protein